MLIDSHSHLFLEDFSQDIASVINRAKEVGVSHIFMPNIDSSTVDSLLHVCNEYPQICHPMIGLHPTSVGTNYQEELNVVYDQLNSDNRYVAIGEIGIDLYWDKTFIKEQIHCFDQQIKWALEYNLPIVIHTRESLDEVLQVLSQYKNTQLKGVFHSFTGSQDDALRLLEYSNFMIGINGVVTFKNSTLPLALQAIPLNRLVVETDSPYLTPVPFRGKRNESAYVKEIVKKLSELYNESFDIVANTTSASALEIFGIL